LKWNLGFLERLVIVARHGIRQVLVHIRELHHHPGARPRARARHAEGHRLHRRRPAKPIIGVANTWIETMPCNYNLRELAVR
jgi:dihydroxyacid dehydratase/phosphogluconate dehydratase